MPERHQTPICSNTHNLLEKNDTYALRGVCMIMIIVHHTYLSAIDLPQCHTDSWLRFLDIGWSWGYDGTGVFLFLSGFGMFFSLLRNRPICKTYIKNKVVKLFIPFLWLWAISLAVYILFDAKQLTPQLFTSFLSLDIPPDNEAWFYKVIIGLYTVSILSCSHGSVCSILLRGELYIKGQPLVVYHSTQLSVRDARRHLLRQTKEYPADISHIAMRHIVSITAVFPSQSDNIKPAVHCHRNKHHTICEHRQPSAQIHRNKQHTVLFS